MKKLMAVVVVFAVVALMSTPVYAGVDKLKTGLTDIVKSPLEIVDHTKAEYNNSTFKPFGVFGGLLKGTFYMGKKIVGGVVDVVTFPIDK
jgi:hypothetical protein